MFSGLTAIIITFAGFLLIALGMDKHYMQFFSGTLENSKKIIFYLAGYFLLAIALVPTINQWGVAMGISAWFGILSVSGSIVVLIFSFKETIKA